MPSARSPVVVRSPRLMTFSPSVMVDRASASKPDVVMFFLLTIVVRSGRLFRELEMKSSDWRSIDNSSSMRTRIGPGWWQPWPRVDTRGALNCKFYCVIILSPIFIGHLHHEL